MLRIKDPNVSVPFYTETSSSFTSSLTVLRLTFPILPSLPYNQIIGMYLIESEQIRFRGPRMLEMGSDDLIPCEAMRCLTAFFWVRAQ